MASTFLDAVRLNYHAWWDSQWLSLTVHVPWIQPFKKNDVLIWTKESMHNGCLWKLNHTSSKNPAIHIVVTGYKEIRLNTFFFPFFIGRERFRNRDDCGPCLCVTALPDAFWSSCMTVLILILHETPVHR